MTVVDHAMITGTTGVGGLQPAVATCGLDPQAQTRSFVATVLPFPEEMDDPDVPCMAEFLQRHCRKLDSLLSSDSLHDDDDEMTDLILDLFSRPTIPYSEPAVAAVTAPAVPLPVPSHPLRPAAVQQVRPAVPVSGAALPAPGSSSSGIIGVKRRMPLANIKPHANVMPVAAPMKASSVVPQAATETLAEQVRLNEEHLQQHGEPLALGNWRGCLKSPHCDRENRHRGICNHKATVPGPMAMVFRPEAQPLQQVEEVEELDDVKRARVGSVEVAVGCSVGELPALRLDAGTDSDGDTQTPGTSQHGSFPSIAGEEVDMPLAMPDLPMVPSPLPKGPRVMRTEDMQYLNAKLLEAEANDTSAGPQQGPLKVTTPLCTVFEDSDEEFDGLSGLDNRYSMLTGSSMSDSEHSGSDSEEDEPSMGRASMFRASSATGSLHRMGAPALSGAGFMLQSEVNDVLPIPDTPVDAAMVDPFASFPTHREPWAVHHRRLDALGLSKGVDRSSGRRKLFPALTHDFDPSDPGVMGAKQCTACSKQQTPVWRAGPRGPKTLCNACGVRWMKSSKRNR